MVAAGVSVHYLAALSGLLPVARPDLAAMVRFGTDYTLWLNVVFAIASGVPLWMAKRSPAHGRHEHGRRGKSASAPVRS
jgi:hypothetical protein